MSEQDTNINGSTFTSAAFQHGEKKGNDNEIDDLRMLFNTAFDLLSLPQRTKFLADIGVQRCLKNGGVTPPEVKRLPSSFKPTGEHDKVLCVRRVC